MAFRLSFIAALLLAATTVARAELKFDSGDKSKVVLTSFGDASTDVNVLCTDSSGVTVSDNTLFTVGTISSAAAAGGYTNYTLPFSFTNGVGTDSYTVTCASESITGSVTAAGLVVKDGGAIVSGENGAGVTVGQSGKFVFDVMSVGTDGAEADLSSCTIVARATSGPYMKEVLSSATSITSSKLTIAIADKRVGSGSFVLDIDCPGINLRGENYETLLKVTQETTPPPPCVAMAGTYTTKDGMVSIPMYNLLSPPQASPIKEVTISIGGSSYSWSKGDSTLEQPDQMVVFKTSAGGKAKIQCDGADAYVKGGDIMVSGDSSSTELATELVSDLPESDVPTITATISVVNSDPSKLSKADGQKIYDAFCKACGLSASDKNCALTAVVKGSAKCEFAANTDTASDAKKTITEEFESCTFQKNLGYDCDELALGPVTAKAVAGAPTALAAGTGLATWTIVLIAGLGAFALIALIMLGLLAVYRRSAEVSESDYSSSGPLGVPDPSDLLYEQSIVRDIYGRGDFPDGGPTAAVAEQRAREADLREEYPRPPSSSGLSRQSAATDDASSTYSV